MEPDQGEKMSVKIDLSGLKKLTQNAKELDGTHTVRLVDMLSPEFVSSHSKFADLNDLFAASGFKIDSPEDFVAIPDDQWDAFIAKSTDFGSWLEMQKSGHLHYVKAKLHKGL